MWVRFSGVFGLVLIAFGLFGAMIMGSFAQPLMLVHLLVGIAALFVWAVQGGLSHFGETRAVLMGRSARFGANALFATVVFAGLLVVANWFAHRYDKRADLTEQRVFSLAAQSEQIIRDLKRPLKMVGFESDTDGEEMRDLLARYGYYNPSKVSTEVVNPRSKPHLVERYEMKAGNALYIEYGEGDDKGVSRINELSEEAITNAIIKLTRGEARKIYYVIGHGEPDITSQAPDGLKQFADAITDEHLKMETILLSQKGSVPNDAAAVLLVSPKKPLLPEEKQSLIDYAEGGGRLLMMTDPMTTPDVKEIADRFGIQVGDDLIIDKVQRLFAGPTLGAQPIVTTYEQHPVTRGMSQEHVTIFNIASSVRIKAKESDGVTYAELAKTGPAAWGETDLQRIFNSDDPSAEFSGEDLKGPVSLAVAYEKKLEEAKPEGEEDLAAGAEPKFEKATRVVVFGDSDFILNANLNVYANRDLALNALNWQVGEEGGITIRPRSIRASSAPIPRSTFLMILTSSFLIPELILLAGLFVWWRRKALSLA